MQTKLAAVIDSLYNEISASLNTNENSELSVVNTVPNISSNIGVTLQKIAMAIRNAKPEVTYTDIEEAIRY